MSRWLKNVGNFLEQLDDRAEQVVEEQRSSGHYLVAGDGQQDEFLESDNVVASILAARGLIVQDEEHDDDNPVEKPFFEQEDDKVDGNDLSQANDQSSHQEKADEDEVAPLNEGWGDVSFSTETPHHVAENLESTGETNDDDQTHHESEPSDSLRSTPGSPVNATSRLDEISPDDDVALAPNAGEFSNAEDAQQDARPGSPSSVPTTDEPVPETSMASTASMGRTTTTASALLVGVKSAAPVLSFSTSAAAKVAATALKNFTSEPPPAQQSIGGSGGESQSSSSQDAADRVNPQNQLLVEMQKEVRTLRRHVVALNQQLEAAEAEMQAQRGELERAAERLQKDSVRRKQDRDNDATRHAQELKTLKAQHETVLADQKSRYDAQLEDLRSQLRTVEERRMQEGGDWNKELADALQREQDTAIKLSSVEDEKATLLSQISTLQAQQEALGGRLESLSETAENATAREREAEDRLDEALSVHARQISQRQAREAELERTIAELGEALVMERNSRGNSAYGNPSTDSTSFRSVESSSDSKVGPLESEVESLRVQLMHEQQRSNTLQVELHKVESERTEETLISQKRQQQHDRQVEELTHALSRIKQELRDVKRDSLKDFRPRSGENNEDGRRIKDLSEEVLRLRDKLSGSQSEMAALKSRLQGALDRAQKAESSLSERDENGATYASDDMELGNGIRHRVPMRKRVRGTGPTMRAALKLDAVHHGGGGTEKIGKTLDALDAFLIESGKFLRFNPLARLLFIVYLMLIHLWTIILLIFHAHGFERIHGDFGSGGSLPHGPGDMMPQLLSLDSHAGAKNATA